MASQVDIDGFTLRYPEFISVGDTRVGLALDDAALLMAPDVWLDKYALGLRLLAAHNLIVMGAVSGIEADSAFPVTSESVGSVSRSYAVPTSFEGVDAQFASTKYGREFVRVRSTLLALPMVI